MSKGAINYLNQITIGLVHDLDNAERLRDLQRGDAVTAAYHDGRASVLRYIIGVLGEKIGSIRADMAHNAACRALRQQKNAEAVGRAQAAQPAVMGQEGVPA